KRSDVEERLILILRENLSSDRGRHRSRIGVGFDHQTVERSRKLRMRQVHLHWRLFVQSILGYVIYYADDGAPRLRSFFSPGKPDAFSDRVLIGPQLRRHRSINQGDEW